MQGIFKYIIVIAFLTVGNLSHAQESEFSIEFARQNPDSKNTGVIDAFVKIKNNTNNNLTGEFDVHSNHEDLYLVQRKPKTVNLNPNDSVFIPVKAIISRTAKAGNKPSIEAVFTTNKNITKSVILPVIITERKLVKMFLLETNLIYENVGDTLTIPIRISNDGNTEQKIDIVTRYPNFIAKDMMETTSIKISAFTDTLVYLKKQVTKQILAQEDFNLTITSLYQSGDIIGIANIRASSIKQDRRYTTQFNPDYAQTFNQTNQITVSHSENSSNASAYYLYANAEAQLNDSKIYTNIDANLWTNSNQLFLRNTWLGYKNNNFGIQAGNVSKFADINLVGRGAQAYYTTSKDSKIEVGGIDKSYNLADYSNPSGGTSAWASYFHNGGWLEKGFESNLIYDHDKFTGINSLLATSKFSVLKKQNFSLRAGGGLSNANYEAANTNKAGAAGEIVAVGKQGSLYYSSTNFVSNGYYAGVKRGVLNFNERVNWTREKYNLWAVYNYMSVKPKSLTEQVLYSTLFTTARYNIGASRRFSNITLSVSPNIYSEKRDEPLYIGGSQTRSMDAYRMNIGLNYSNHISTVNLIVDGGSFKTNIENQPSQFHIKANLIYSWKFLNLLTTYQYNSFNLGEAIANYQTNPNKTFYNIMVNPSAVLKFFDSKLILYTGATFASNTINDRITQFSGRADYKISPDFSLFVNGYYSDISNNPYSLNSFQVGLTKQFRPIRIDSSKSDLEIYVYYENDGKGTENSPAANQLIIISGKAFRTNNQGIIKYRSLPAGDYEIRPVSTNEWHAYSRTVNIIQDTQLSIGLTKTSTIKGSVSYTQTERSYEITKKLGGLSIIAVDDIGNIFQSRTDDTGNFVLYVPKGYYTITIEKSDVSEYVDIEHNNRNIQAIPDTIAEVKFNLNIKEKRVETRKFSSRGFPSQSSGNKKKKK